MVGPGAGGQGPSLPAEMNSCTTEKWLSWAGTQVKPTPWGAALPPTSPLLPLKSLLAEEVEAYEVQLPTVRQESAQTVRKTNS